MTTRSRLSGRRAVSSRSMNPARSSWLRHRVKVSSNWSITTTVSRSPSAGDSGGAGAGGGVGPPPGAPTPQQHMAGPRARAPPRAEDAPARPLAPYGATKLAGTLAITTSGLDAVVLRVTNPVGPGAPTAGLPGRLTAELRRAAEQSPHDTIRVGDLSSYRDFVDVRDMAEAVTLAITTPHPLPPILNIGSGQSVPARDLAHGLVRAAAFRGRIEETLTGSGRSAAVPWQCADITAAARELGWQPAFTLTESLAALWTADGAAGKGAPSLRAEAAPRAAPVTHAESGTASGAGQGSRLGIQSGSAPEPGPGTAPRTGPGTAPGTTPGARRGVAHPATPGPDAEPGNTSGAGQDSGPGMQSGCAPEPGPSTAPHTGAGTAPGTGPGTESDTAPDAHPGVAEPLPGVPAPGRTAGQTSRPAPAPAPGGPRS
ncbi:NAD-dependent epimerase/dehydratase family protein [Streptomyces lasiicapitis]|uniref:NAD-dependent epimerase/dehydratase family protein n=1 Tax=Streptomyces lasiicapitis TaxID=1923961 RepID=UPI0036A42F29